MNDELLVVIEHIEREKGIDKEYLFKAIEQAFVSAARKIIGNKEADVTVEINRSSGKISIISDGKELRSEEFGRIAAQTAKQVIIQKIREAERDIVYDDYQKRVGTIISGSVHRFEKGDIVVDLGKTEAILPKSQQSPKERYKQGDRLRAYIVAVNKTAHGPQIVLSRADAAFVKKLFETEVPEITDGIVEIRAIAREAGERTKIAVWSKDDKVDPVGACVGMRGSRVKDIVRELYGERVDIIPWRDDVREYVREALRPTEIAEIKVDKEAKRIEVVVPDDQLSIGIGKHGQNIRLASKLIGWEMDIRGKEGKAVKAAELLGGQPEEGQPEAVAAEAGGDSAVPVPEEAPAGLTGLAGVGEKTAAALIAAGYDTIEKLQSVSVEDLTKVDGIGPKTAEKIIKSAKGGS